MKNEDAISELVDQTLLLALVAICAGVFGVIILGFTIPVEKTAYLVPEFGIQDAGGNTVIWIFDRGGDPVYFNITPQAKYRAAFYVDTAEGSFRAYPDKYLVAFQPGDTIYLYNTDTGFVATRDLTGASILPLPVGGIVVRIVDINSGVLIAKATLVEGPVTTGTVTATVTPTANVTTATTTTPTSATTVSTTITTATPTATATPSSYPITVSWVPKGTGVNAAGTVTPPGTNDAIVTVATGSSQTFTIKPNVNNRVRSVLLDGVEISTGGVLNQTVLVTVPGVHASHTLTVHFASK